MRREIIEGRDAIRMRGDVSIANNGGFLQIVLDLAPSSAPVDASRWSGIEKDVSARRTLQDPLAHGGRGPPLAILASELHRDAALADPSAAVRRFRGTPDRRSPRPAMASARRHRRHRTRSRQTSPSVVSGFTPDRAKTATSRAPPGLSASGSGNRSNRLGDRPNRHTARQFRGSGIHQVHPNSGSTTESTA